MELEAHVDQLRLRLANLVGARLELLVEKVSGLRRRLVSPDQQMQMWRFRLQERVSHLQRSIVYYLEHKKATLTELSARLDLLSPLKTLDRGYAIVLDNDGKAVVDGSRFQPGDQLDVKFSIGTARVEVRERGE